MGSDADAIARDRKENLETNTAFDKQRSLALLQQQPLIDFQLLWVAHANRVGWGVHWLQSPRVQGVGSFAVGMLLSSALAAGGVAASLLTEGTAVLLLAVIALTLGVLSWANWSFHTDRLAKRQRHGDVLKLVTEEGVLMVETMFGRIPRQGCMLQLITGRTRPKGGLQSSAPFWYGHAILINDGEDVHVGSWVKGGSGHQRAIVSFAEFNKIEVSRLRVRPENALEEHELSGIFVHSAFG